MLQTPFAYESYATVSTNPDLVLIQVKGPDAAIGFLQQFEIFSVEHHEAGIISPDYPSLYFEQLKYIGSIFILQLPGLRVEIPEIVYDPFVSQI